MDHHFLSCQLTTTGQCAGCRNGFSRTCLYEELAVCSICGGGEGELLPLCPGYQLYQEEHDDNYQHFMDKTGPFAEMRIH